MNGDTMSEVFFVSASADEGSSVLANKTVKLFDRLSEKYSPISDEDLVGIKIHFGEENNTGHIKPSYLEKFIDRIKESGGKPYLTDANTLYEGQRLNSVDHLMQASEHGFTPDNLGAPIIIADGILSKNFTEVDIPGKHFDNVRIANDILHSDVLIGASHVTGHPLACFGGTIKNLGMGSASRSGKQQQHADIKPEVDQEECRECGLCAKWCPVDAIEVVDGVGAKIDLETCYGCAECITTCPYDVISNEEEGSSQSLQEKMAEYTFGVLKSKEEKSLFFNFLIHVTEGCDCFDEDQDRIIDDIGILASYDPVAVDRAAIDLLNKEAGRDLLKEKYEEDDLDYSIQIDHAESLGLGSQQYELVEI